MKNKLTIEWQRVLAVKSKGEFYLIFFRVVQGFCALGLLYFLLFTMPMMSQLAAMGEMGMPMNPAWFVLPTILSAGQLVLCEAALRAVEKGKFWGSAVGLLLSSFYLPSWTLILGAFGLFAFLNADFQKKHMKEAPELFRGILTSLGINAIDAKETESVNS